MATDSIKTLLDMATENRNDMDGYIATNDGAGATVYAQACIANATLAAALVHRAQLEQSRRGVIARFRVWLFGGTVPPAVPS